VSSRVCRLNVDDAVDVTTSIASVGMPPANAWCSQTRCFCNCFRNVDDIPASPAIFANASIPCRWTSTASHQMRPVAAAFWGDSGRTTLTRFRSTGSSHRTQIILNRLDRFVDRTCYWSSRGYRNKDIGGAELSVSIRRRIWHFTKRSCTDTQDNWKLM
jgi:hypothetical protein